MTLLELLVDKLDGWDESYPFATQDVDGEVYLWESSEDISLVEGIWRVTEFYVECEFLMVENNMVQDWNKTILSRDEWVAAKNKKIATEEPSRWDGTHPVKVGQTVGCTSFDGMHEYEVVFVTEDGNYVCKGVSGNEMFIRKAEAVPLIDPAKEIFAKKLLKRWNEYHGRVGLDFAYDSPENTFKTTIEELAEFIYDNKTVLMEDIEDE